MQNKNGRKYFMQYSLKTERREAFRELLEAVQSAVPELEELDFPVAGAGHVNMTWRQKDFSQVFHSNQLSDGILRFLWLMTVLHTAPDDGLILIDEPELHLHPNLQLKVLDYMRVLTTSQSAQVIGFS